MSQSNLRNPDILIGKKSLAPYPMDKVRHVDHITTDIVGEIRRLNAHDQGFMKALDGRLGSATKKEFAHYGKKMPLSNTLTNEVGPLFNPIRDGEVFPTQAPLPDNPAIISAHIKALGYFLKSQAVGICELPPWVIYSHDAMGKPIECKHKYAIVILSEWDYETMAGSTGSDWISNSESYLTYNASAHIACSIAGYIRRLGFPARAHFQSGRISAYDMPVTPLIVLAGLGELSRAGWALNPFLGGRFKASVVTTDLPLQIDRPIDVGIQKFCRTCKKCALACPAKAISMADEKTEHNGYMAWPLNAERCTKFRICNQYGCGCGQCVKVCPWNKPRGRIHDMVRWAIRTLPVVDPWIAKLDTFLGYGKQDLNWKWWFDFEASDTEIHHARYTRRNG